jgi:hypothetical protein
MMLCHHGTHYGDSALLDKRLTFLDIAFVSLFMSIYDHLSTIIHNFRVRNPVQLTIPRIILKFV